MATLKCEVRKIEGEPRSAEGNKYSGIVDRKETNENECVLLRSNRPNKFALIVVLIPPLYVL